MNTFHKHLWTFTVLFVCNLSYLLTQQVINNKGDNGSPSDVHIECNSEAIMVTINTTSCYNGMIYPKGLATNSSCMLEFNDRDNVTYVLPLRSCNTMSADVVSKLFKKLPFLRVIILRMTTTKMAAKLATFCVLFERCVCQLL